MSEVMSLIYSILQSKEFTYFYNIAIVLITFVAIVCYVKQYYRLKQSADRFIQKLKDIKTDNRDEIIREIHSYFESTKEDVLKDVWNAYFELTNKMKEDGIIDPLYYFQADKLIKSKTSRKRFDQIPGILVTLGIFGTFLGLVAGLKSIDSSNVDSLKSGIDQLLNGMILAFSSSVWGIFCSLFWIGFDKMYHLPKMHKKLNSLENLLDSLLYRSEEQILLENLLKIQRQSAETLKTFLSDSIIPEIMNQFSKVIRDTLVPHMESQTAVMQQVVNSQSDGTLRLLTQLEEQTKVFQDFAQNSAQKQAESLDQMVNEFIDRLHGVTQDHFEALNHTLINTIEVNNQIHHHLIELIQKVEEAAEKQTSMTESFYVIWEKLDSKAEWLTDLQQELQHTLERFSEIGRNIEEQTEKMFQLQSLIKESWELASAEHEHLQNIYEKIREDLEYHVHQMSNQIEKMNQYWQEMSQSWEQSRQTIADLNEQLGTSVQSFADHVHQGITRTLAQFDEHLSKAIQHIAQGVASLQEVTGELPDSIAEFAEYVRKLNALQNEVATGKEA